MFEKKPGEGYNGWPNHATWNAFNWLSSSEKYQRECENLCDSEIDIRNVMREAIESGYVLDSFDFDDVDWGRLLQAFTG